MQIVTIRPSELGQHKGPLIKGYMQVFRAPPWNENWWTETLVQEVLAEYAGTNVTYVLALSGEDVVGFCFGAFWYTSELERELNLQLPYPPEQIVGYIKDVGVSHDFRQQRLAGQMLQQLINTLKPMVGEGPLLARTLATPDPSVVYQWFPKLGFQVVTGYPEGHERRGQVILAAHSISKVVFEG